MYTNDSILLSTEIVYCNQQKKIISQFTIAKKTSERIRSGKLLSGETKFQEKMIVI